MGQRRSSSGSASTSPCAYEQRPPSAAETVEAQVWRTDRLFPGRIVVNSRAGALQMASERRQGDENGRLG